MSSESPDDCLHCPDLPDSILILPATSREVAQGHTSMCNKLNFAAMHVQRLSEKPEHITTNAV